MKKQRSYALLFLTLFFLACSARHKEPVRVGVLHSLSGTLAISGRSVVDATLLAIDEVNASGGVLGGRKVEPVVVDIGSDPSIAAKIAEEMIERDKVSAIFGCWTSLCRKEVKKVVEKHDALLFYPVQYEGLEESRNIVCTGAVPNQQIIPAVKWFLENKGRRVYLVGSDYVFPRTANLIIRDMVAAQGGTVVGERYVPLGSRDLRDVAGEIRSLRPDVVFNTINGDTNLHFFHALKEAGLTSKGSPVVSFSIAEDELRQLKGEGLEGHYAVWNYFQSIRRDENRRFVDSFKRRYGADRVTDDPMESAYVSVHLWANAVNEAGFTDAARVRNMTSYQSFNAPEGIVSVEPNNLHLWKMVYVGRITPESQFDVVWSSDRPVRPHPFPRYRSRQEWESFANGRK